VRWTSRASCSAAILDLDGDGDLDIVTNNYGDVPQGFISDLAQRGPALSFGLGTATQVDSIMVNWPTGKQQVVGGPHRSGSTVVVKEQ
jgi:hypothetical protein